MSVLLDPVLLLDKPALVGPPAVTIIGQRDLASVIRALVTLRLDYCNSVYMGLSLEMAPKLQLLQNAAACMLIRPANMIM